MKISLKTSALAISVLLIVGIATYTYQYNDSRRKSSSSDSAELSGNISKTYTDVNGFYSISYSDDTKVMPVYGDDDYTCIKLERGFGYILIDTGSITNPCGPSGVGDGVRVEDKVTIGNKKYDAVGFMKDKDRSSSFLNFNYTDKIKVTYGVKSSRGLTEGEYKKAMDDIKVIVDTLR